MTSQFKLEGTVGPNNDVEPRDARKVKQALMRLGDLDSADVAPLDFLDRPTLESLKTFQKRNGFVADGIVKPGGPTERAITVTLAEQDKDMRRRPPNHEKVPTTLEPPESGPERSATKTKTASMITAKPSGIVVFNFPGHAPPSHGKLKAAHGGVENKKMHDDMEAEVNDIKLPIFQELEGPEELVKKDDCLIECISQQLGLSTIVEIATIGAGAPVVKKRFVMPGSSPRTSIASTYIPKAIPKRFQKLPKRIWAPTTVRPLAVARFTGRVIARWIPFVGWGLLAHDVVQIARCTDRCEKAK